MSRSREYSAISRNVMQRIIVTLVYQYSLLAVAGLELWSGIFSREGRTGFLELVGDNSDRSERADLSQFGLPKRVFFLVLNCLLSDNGSTRETAATCVVDVAKYITQQGN